MANKQDCKVFIGGLSWDTTGEKLRAYFENFGAVREAFVSYNRTNGRPRGFGFVVFESTEVADKVVAAKHTIDRREVEAKKAIPKVDEGLSQPAVPQSAAAPQRTSKVFVGGLSPAVTEQILRQHFEQFGTVEDAVVMYDHENKRPRGFGFVQFSTEEAVNRVFSIGTVQTILDKPIEIKPAVPRDQIPPGTNRGIHATPYHLLQQRGYPVPRGSPHGYFLPPSQAYTPLPPRPFAGRGYHGSLQPKDPSFVLPPHPGPGSATQPSEYVPIHSQATAPFSSSGGTPMQGASPRNGPAAPRPSNPYEVYQGLPNPPMQNGVSNVLTNQALFNFAHINRGLNGLANPTSTNSATLTALNNQLHALSLTSNLATAAAGGFPYPSSQPEAFSDDTAFSHTDADYGPEAVKGLSKLGVSPPEYSSHFPDATPFTAAPGPGWSS